MKAVICTKYGPPEVLQIQEVEKPVPRDNEVLIKIYTTTVHIGDTKIRSFKPGMGRVQDILMKLIMRFLIGFHRPRKSVLGMELAGRIEAIGKNVKLFLPGDRVFAATEMNFGAYAEYTCLPECGAIAKIPANISFEEAAPIPNGGITALNMLRKAKVQSGQKVLIYGASGSLGTFTVQLAKHFGAKVDGVCSTTNLEMVRALGAEKVIDYTKEDFSEGSEKYDVILDVVGKIAPPLRKKALKKTGVYLNILRLSGGLKLNPDDLLFLKSLMEEGKLKSVIDRRFSLEQIVEAHRYVDHGHKKGNVLITV